MTATTNQLGFYSFPSSLSIGLECSSFETSYTEPKAELHSDSFESHPLSFELMLFSLVNLLLDLYCCLQWFFFLQSQECVYRFFSCPPATETFFLWLQSKSQNHGMSICRGASLSSYCAHHIPFFKVSRRKPEAFSFLSFLLDLHFFF